MCSIGGIEDGDATNEGCQKFDPCEKRQEPDSGLRQQLTADQPADTKTHHECRDDNGTGLSINADDPE
jgi:hypothetical protein